MGGIDWQQHDSTLIHALLARWQPLLAARRIDIRLGDPDDEDYLTRREAEAAFIPPDPSGEERGILLLRATPSRSAVLEEVAHAMQHLRRRFEAHAHEGELVVSIHKELEVAECLDVHATRFGIPAAQRARTAKAIEHYQQALKKAEERW